MTLTSKLSQLWHRRTSDASPRHLWAIATVTTADGVSAHVQIEFTLDAQAVDVDPDAVDWATMDAVEDILRQEMGRSRVASLPMAGDALDWVPPDLVPGAPIANVFVLSSDVEVTHELRRLVTHAAGP